MKNTKLLDIIKELSNKDLRKFKEFVHSPYFNKNEDISKLCDIIYIKARYSKYGELSKKNIFKELFPGIKFQDNKIRNLISELMKLLEYFIAISEFSEEKIKVQNYLISALNKKNIGKHVGKYVDIAMTTQEDSPYKDGDFYLNQFQLEVNKNTFIEKKQKRINGVNLQNIADNLDLFFLTNKLKYCCEIYNFRNIIDADYKVFLLDEILQYVEEHSFDHIPSIRIYHQILMTLTDSGNETHYSTLKELLLKHADGFSPKEARDMYAYAQNYCVKKINLGESKYTKELFDLLRELLNKEFIFEDGYLSPWYFKNIVTVGLRLKEYSWIEQFIVEYAKFLAFDVRKNAVQYNLASLYYYKKEFSMVLKHLINVDYSDDVYYHLDSKTLLLKTYFELDDTEGILSLIDSFIIYLSRNKLISTYQRTVYKNLISYTKKLMNLRLKNATKEQFDRLTKQINETKQVADINWLLKKVNDQA